MERYFCAKLIADVIELTKKCMIYFSLWSDVMRPLRISKTLEIMPHMKSWDILRRSGADDVVIFSLIRPECPVTSVVRLSRFFSESVSY